MFTVERSEAERNGQNCLVFCIVRWNDSGFDALVFVDRRFYIVDVDKDYLPISI